MAGLTNQGLEIKRLQDIIADLKARANVIFSDLVPSGDSVDTSANTALGRMIGVVSPSNADLWELAQAVNDAFDPAKATGFALDRLVAFAGIERYPSVPSKADVILEGSTGTVLLLNSKAYSPTTNETYSLESTITLDTNNVSGVGIRITTINTNTSYTVNYQIAGEISPTAITITSDAVSTSEDAIFDQFVSAIESSHAALTTEKRNGYLFISKVDPLETMSVTTSNNIGVQKVQKLGVMFNDRVGAIEQPANTISSIATPVLGWDRVYNPVAAVPGRLVESDEELRERFFQSRYLRASNTFDSLFSDLFNVEGVREIRIYENDTDTEDENGIPPHSFMAIVRGGLSSQIAQTIWNNKPAGIATHGNTTVTISDIQGLPRSVNFERPVEVPIYISMTITPFATLPEETAQRIKDALRAYFEENYSIGSEIRYSRLFTPINSISGFDVDELYIGIDENPSGTSNIQLAFNEIWTLDDDDIVITVTP